MFTKVTHLGKIDNSCYSLYKSVRQYTRVLTIKAPKNNFEITEASKLYAFTMFSLPVYLIVTYLIQLLGVSINDVTKYRTIFDSPPQPFVTCFITNALALS